MEIDVERSFTPEHTAAKSRRIADAMEAGKFFSLQVAGNRPRFLPDGRVEIEMQADGDNAKGKIEIEIKSNRNVEVSG